MRNFMTSVLFASALVVGGQAVAGDGMGSLSGYAAQQSNIALNSKAAGSIKASDATASVQVRSSQPARAGFQHDPAASANNGSGR